MTIRALFFGTTADTVGSREIDLAAEKTTTARSLIDQLSKDHPALANHKLLLAVNEEYADADTILSEGDDIALFRAFSGG